jgi:hypothetical protein
MTEADWVNATDPEEMLTFLRESGRLSERKARLFAVACCRRGWHLLREQEFRDLIGMAERYADQPTDTNNLFRTAEQLYERPGSWTGTRPLGACEAEHAVLHVAGLPPGSIIGWWPETEPHARTLDPSHEYLSPVSLASQAAGLVARALARGIKHTPPRKAVVRAESGVQAALLRCVFSNPFRPLPALDPAWLTWNGGTVPRLAAVAYEGRQLPSGHLDPARLAVLADALEEAGCTDPHLLDHLRGPGPHYRGCWPLDLLLGKQ